MSDMGISSLALQDSSVIIEKSTDFKVTSYLCSGEGTR
jgi:hypothetical protein